MDTGDGNTYASTVPGGSGPTGDSHSTPSTPLEQSGGNPPVSSDGSDILISGSVSGVGPVLSAEPSSNGVPPSTAGSHPFTGTDLSLVSTPDAGSVPSGDSGTDAVSTSITGSPLSSSPGSGTLSYGFGSGVEPASNTETPSGAGAPSNAGPLSIESTSSVGSFSTPNPASSPPLVSISTSISSAIPSSDIGSIPSSGVSQFSSSSASSSRTTVTPPKTSVVVLSVQLQALGAENVTKRGLARRKLGWAQLQGRQEGSPDMPDPETSSGFVGNNTINNPDTCTDASLYVQSRGQLRASGKSLSVDPGVDYINIIDYPGGSISTLFGVVNGTLVWENAAFYNGSARFCQLSNGTVFAMFTQQGVPFNNCTIVNLVVYTGE